MAKNIATDIICDIKNMNSYKDFFDILPKHIKMKNGRNVFYFTRYWSYIPDKFFYDVYKEIMYDVRRNNYFKGLFGINLERRIKKFNQNDTANNPKLKSLADENGYLTIYRGHSSRYLRNTASWTLNKDFAHWFGKRISILNKTVGYYIFTGKVKLDDIFTYLTKHNEEEIVVLPKYVSDKKTEYFDFKI